MSGAIAVNGHCGGLGPQKIVVRLAVPHSLKKTGPCKRGEEERTTNAQECHSLPCSGHVAEGLSGSRVAWEHVTPNLVSSQPRRSSIAGIKVTHYPMYPMLYKAGGEFLTAVRFKPVAAWFVCGGVIANTVWVERWHHQAESQPRSSPILLGSLASS